MDVILVAKIGSISRFMDIFVERADEIRQFLTFIEPHLNNSLMHIWLLFESKEMYS